MGKPLQDIVVSATYIADNVEVDIHDQVQKLGGQFRKTVDAALHFLIVGERFTDKYNFAVAHAATLISADTFFDVYLEWKAGRDIDFVGELRARALKPFEGLIISTTNLSADQKEGFRELIEAGGGVYSKDLIKKCRMLVSPELKGKKATVAPSWHIPVVHPKWISESLKIKSAIDPARFDLHLPESEMGIVLSPYQAPPAGPAVSADDRPAPVPKRRKSDLLFGGARRSSAPTVSAPTASAPTASMPGGLIGSASAGSASAGSALMASSAASMSLWPPSNTNGSATPSFTRKNFASTVLFTNKTFTLHGFDTRQLRILKRFIESHMGKVVVDETAEYAVVNSTAPPKLEPLNAHTHVITEWAIERSLDHKELALDDDWGKPVYTRPTVGFTGLAVCVTGFTGIELRHVVELIKLTGATFAETLTKSRDLLIANSPSARKLHYAVQWNIPVASVGWLWQSALAGQALPLTESNSLDGKGDRPPPQPRAHEATARPSTSISSVRETGGDDIHNEATADNGLGPYNEDHIGYHDEDAAARAQLLIALGEKPASPPPAEPTATPAVSNLKRPRRSTRR